MSCAGRRIELMRAFRRAAEAIDLPIEIYAADASWSAPAMHLADDAIIVPRVDSREYIPRLLSFGRWRSIACWCAAHPSCEMAEAREEFSQRGCTAVISSPRVVATCRDKLKTFQALSAAGVDTPETWTLAEAVKHRRHTFPYFLKPRQGSASKGSFKISAVDELTVIGRRVPDAIVQEFVPGVEHTLDVYTGFDGVPRCAVPRRRIEVRGAKWSSAGGQGPAADRHGLSRGRVLGECCGVITIQLILTARGDGPHSR